MKVREKSAPQRRAWKERGHSRAPPESHDPRLTPDSHDSFIIIVITTTALILIVISCSFGFVVEFTQSRLLRLLCSCSNLEFLHVPRIKTVKLRIKTSNRKREKMNSCCKTHRSFCQSLVIVVLELSTVNMGELSLFHFY